MSTRIEKPEQLEAVNAGSSCSVCWGQGKTFGAGETPESIFVTFEGIEQGPEWIPFDGDPVDGEFEVPQVGGNPCRYQLGAFPSLVAIVEFKSDGTLVVGGSDGSTDSFVRDSPVICGSVFGNEITRRFKNGTATIRIPGVL